MKTLIELSSLPRPVQDLLEWLTANAKTPVVLCTLPAELQKHDVLFIAVDQKLIEIVKQVGAGIASTVETIATWNSWCDYRQCGFSSLSEALANDQQPDSTQRLHVRLTEAGNRAIVYQRTQGATQPGHIRLAVAVKKYQVTRKTLRKAVNDKKLIDYRPPGSAKNARISVDEAAVKSIWLERP